MSDTMTPVPRPYLLQKLPPAAPQSPLLAHARNVTSQRGEDGIVERIFALIPPRSRWCVECGAWDGRTFSNTWNLIHRHGWSAGLIEGDPARYAMLAREVQLTPAVRCLERWVEMDGPHRLDALLTEIGVPADLDFLSIDVDGIDYFIWESLQQYRPTLVVVEFNPTVPNDVRFIQARDRQVNQGCSVLALVELGRRKGYELVCCTGWNAFFVVAEQTHALGVTDRRLEKLFVPLMDGRIFHGYDGTVHVVGMDRLAWHGRPLSAADFQVLPATERRYPGPR
jgi:hypothetical protein